MVEVDHREKIPGNVLTAGKFGSDFNILIWKWINDTAKLNNSFINQLLVIFSI